MGSILVTIFIYGAIASMIIVPLIIVFFIIQADKKGCTLEIEATITGFKSFTVYDLDHPNMENYYGTYTYTYNGKQYNGEGSGLLPWKHHVGQRILIYINPNKPWKSSTYKQFQRLVNRNIIIFILCFIFMILFVFGIGFLFGNS